MNDICIELQNKYEVLMDLIEGSTAMIWDYEMKSLDETDNQTYSFTVKPASTTEFIKLGIVDILSSFYPKL